MIPAIVYWIMAAAAAVSAYGSIQQAKSAEELGEYNAKVAERQAEETISAGAVEEERHRAKVRQLQGSQMAAQGASGALAGEGTFGDLLEQSAQYGEMDALTIRANAARRAYGLQAQGSADRLEGAMAASRARTQGYTTLLSAAGDVYKGGSASGWWGGKPSGGGIG